MRPRRLIPTAICILAVACMDERAPVAPKPNESAKTLDPTLPFGPAVSRPATSPGRGLSADVAPSATGTVLRGPFVPTGPTGNGRGMAFDGTNLYYTIVGDANIYRTNTSGVLQSTIGVP